MEHLVSDLEERHAKLSDYGIEGLEVAIAAARYGWKEMPPPPPHEETGRRRRRLGREENEEDEEDWVEGDDLRFKAVGFNELFPSEWSSSDDLGQALTRAKLNVMERQGRDEDYLALCLKADAHLRYALKLCELGRVREAISSGLKNLTIAEEALVLAQGFRKAGHIDEALKIGERGLKLAGQKVALGEWLAGIEEAQGRNPQALEAWLAAFSDNPSLLRYQMIKRLAAPERWWRKLQPEVRGKLEKCSTKQPLAEVLLFEEEWDEAIKIAERNAADYRVVETVADAVARKRPEWVVRASLKQAERLIAETKSKYYPTAAEWLRKAKAGYSELGQEEKWRKYLQGLKEEYKRRPALQAELARL
jgi:uncharacterized Zn finger protein